MVANGPSLPLSNTPVICKAREVYGQLAEKGLLGEVGKIEEKNRRRQAAVLVEESLKNVRPRQAGAEFVCLDALKRLTLRNYLSSQDWDKDKINLAMIQIAARAIYPYSEHKTVKYLRENSALCEFFGVEPKQITKDRLYRSSRDLFFFTKAWKTIFTIAYAACSILRIRFTSSTLPMRIWSPQNCPGFVSSVAAKRKEVIVQ